MAKSKKQKARERALTSAQKARATRKRLLAEGRTPPPSPDAPDAPQARAREWPDLPEPWMPHFLDLFACGVDATHSAEGAGVGHSTVYDWRKRSEVFAEAWKQAEAEFDDRIRGESKRRAIDGVLEPVFHQGRIVGHVLKYSDRLLERLLEARCPEFRRKVEGSLQLGGIPGGTPVQVEVKDEHGDPAQFAAEVAAALVEAGVIIPPVSGGDDAADQPVDDAPAAP